MADIKVTNEPQWDNMRIMHLWIKPSSAAAFCLD